MIPGGVNPMLLSAGGSGFQVQRSLRLRASAAAYLSRTLTTNSSPQRATWSFWVKQGSLTGHWFAWVARSSGGSNDVFQLLLDSTGLMLFVRDGGLIVQANGTVPMTLRDPTAWYHITIAFDTTQAVSYDRIKVYVNDQQRPNSSASVFNQNTTLQNLFTNAQYLHTNFGSGTYSDCHFADFHCVDGQALTPTSFGEFDPSGNWRPKAYSGTYGTNGFRLDFSDPTSLTTLVADSSGNGNNWTANNISLTAGATYDSMLDVPLGGGGNERGNYCTIDPLTLLGLSSGQEANLSVSHVTAPCLVKATQGISSGKWYCEYTVVSIATNWPHIGLTDNARPSSAAFGGGAADYTYYGFNGNKWNNNVSTAYGSGYGAGDVISVAFDADAGSLTFYKNGVSQGVAFTGIPAGTHFLTTGMAAGSGTIRANFGQRPFAYTPPAGFKALHTGNMTSDTVTVSGSFTGNAIADGPPIWMNGAPETLTINGNAVTWGTHADKTAGGFKLRTSSSSYNSSGTNTWTATVLTPASKSAFRKQLAKTN